MSTLPMAAPNGPTMICLPPQGGIEAACGLAAFVHGGYWVALSKDDVSHMVAGLLARGWAVAILGYTLAPQARITQITQEISRAVEHLGKAGQAPGRFVLLAIRPAGILSAA